MINRQHKLQTPKYDWLKETGVIVLFWVKSSLFEFMQCFLFLHFGSFCIINEESYIIQINLIHSAQVQIYSTSVRQVQC